MKLKKFGALLLTGVLAITSLTTSAFAAKRELSLTMQLLSRARTALCWIRRVSRRCSA